LLLLNFSIDPAKYSHQGIDLIFKVEFLFQFYFIHPSSFFYCHFSSQIFHHLILKLLLHPFHSLTATTIEIISFLLLSSIILTVYGGLPFQYCVIIIMFSLSLPLHISMNVVYSKFYFCHFYYKFDKSFIKYEVEVLIISDKYKIFSLIDNYNRPQWTWK
jgi:hypothetical protein